MMFPLMKKVNIHHIFWLAIFLIILFTQFFDIFAGHIENFSNQYKVNDDARPQIAPFITYHKGADFDYFDEYYLNALHPIFYKTLYFISSDIFSINPIVVSKALPYLLFGAFLIYAFRIGRILENNLIGYALILAYLSTEIIFSRMVGGLPHGFGFVIIIAGVYYLLQNNFEKAFVTGIIGVGFYPACAIFILFSTGVPIILQNKLRKKLPLIITSFLLCLTIALPSIVSSLDYGGVVSRYELEEFPEADIGGRNSKMDIIEGRVLYAFIVSLNNSFFSNYSSIIQPLYLTIILVILIISLSILRKNRGSEVSKLILLLWANCFILYAFSVIFSPILYFPERYFSYTFPVIFPLLIVTALKERFNEKKYIAEIIFILVIILTLTLKPKTSDNTGFTINESDKKHIFEFIEKLPEKSLVAGYPKGVMDGVKYFSGKNFYMNYETSVPIHKEHMLEVRERAKALFKAYYATDIKTLKKFRDATGVTHIIAQEAYLDIEQQIPYYKPFDEYISGLYEDAKNENKNFILPSLREKAIFEYQDYYIIDLKTL